MEVNENLIEDPQLITTKVIGQFVYYIFTSLLQLQFGTK